MKQGAAPSAAAFTLYGWDHRSPAVRLVAPWEHAGVRVLHGTEWDRVFSDKINDADLVILHRDFPRLAEAYRKVMRKARGLGKPVFFDLDDLLFDLPEEHPDRQFQYISDALFPVLQAVLEADAVTVSTAALKEAIQPLNPNTLLLPTYLNDSLWGLAEVQATDHHMPVVIGWINDQPPSGPVDNCTIGLEQFLRHRENEVLLRIWGRKPPDALLALANVDWLADIPTSYASYTAKFCAEHIDLALIPHGDSSFDVCQSPLRFLEHSACRVPGIYSRVPPYQDVISHQQDGWLASTAEEWRQALETLFESAGLRERIAAAAQNNIRNKWLLSQNAYRWKEAFDMSADLSKAHDVLQPLVRQAVNLSDQVRCWQRDLERRLYDRKWEVRATNVMMARKDRQASNYIEQLGSQLEQIWNDPTWRLLNKAKKLVKTAAAPDMPDTAAGTGSDPERGIEPRAEVPAFSKQPQKIAPAATFDLLWFTGNRWEDLPEKQRSRAVEFANDGIRCVIISAGNQPRNSPDFRQAMGGIYELSLPTPEPSQFASGLQAAVFADLRLELGIYEAVCLIDDPIWGGVGYRLRNIYGWKVAASAGHSHGSQEAQLLIKRADLVSPSPADKMTYPAIRQALYSLYPKTSLVILTYNNLRYTKQCLDSIHSKTAYPNFEVIIVDNASTDGTVDFLHDYAASHPHVRLVCNAENLGFSAGNNQGIAASQGEYIVFLNNDTLVTQGWLSGLMSHLRDPAVGAVGPVTNSSGNESKIAVDYSDISGLDDFARRYTRAHDGQAFEIRMLALYCMLVRRSVVAEVGPLDESFGVGMYEDDDFSLRIRQKGYRILCAEDVYIHHWGSASFSKLDEEHYQRLHLENRQKFEEKWGTEWQPHRWRMDEV